MVTETSKQTYLELLVETLDIPSSLYERSFTGAVGPQQLEPGGLQVWLFHNDYPMFSDTNNLSLLTFLDVGGVSFVLGGDLERAGWLALLQKPQVQGLLKRVHVFVASHHERESGYCPEVFDYCKLRLIVMSDGPIQHDTQLMAGTYARHALGELFSTPSGQVTRKVVSTRKDGNIFWNL